MSQLSFNYQAINADGARTKGVIAAGNRQDAYRKLTAAGLKPLRIASGSVKRHRGKKVTVKDLAHLTHQFAVLMEARIPIVDGLRSIAEQETNGRLRAVLMEVSDHIEAGNTVTDAISKHRDMFGDVYVETVRAAEQSGNMIEVMHHLGTMLDRQYEMSKSVRAALLYPICVISALGFAVTFLLIFVVPKFAEMFQSRGLPLPAPTLILIGFSTFIRTYWMFVLASFGLSGYLWRKAWRSPKWRPRMDVFVHHVPVVKKMLQGLAVSRFTHVLGVTLRSGIGVVEALDMAGRASARPLMQLDSEKLRDQVNRGGRLSDVLVGCSYLPPFTRRMLSAGEEAAELPRMCDVVARHYDREVSYQAKQIATVIEPIMVVGLAGVVLIVALAIFLPLWNMGSLIA
ncbi:MAG: type II secretion system F family protein [Planctomycetota bacterium]